MLAQVVASWLPSNVNEQAIQPSCSSDQEEEKEEFTEYVVKNTWSDFLTFLMGYEEIAPNESEVTEQTIQKGVPEADPSSDDKSFSKVMANIITTDAGAESSENDESLDKH